MKFANLQSESVVGLLGALYFVGVTGRGPYLLGSALLYFQIAQNLIHQTLQQAMQGHLIFHHFESAFLFAKQNLVNRETNSQSIFPTPNKIVQTKKPSFPHSQEFALALKLYYTGDPSSCMKSNSIHTQTIKMDNLLLMF